jgi:hypothetical protein
LSHDYQRFLFHTENITIDFGDSCRSRNGVLRSGKIIITHTGPYRRPGTVIHTVSENYFVNGNKVDIDRTVTNEGPNDAGHPVFTVESSRTITFPDGSTASGSSSKTRIWIAGFMTPIFGDDVYKVTGTGSHTSRNGIVHEYTTITPLIRKISCHQFVSGEVRMVRISDRKPIWHYQFREW